MAKLFEGIFKAKQVDHSNLGDLFYEIGTVAFATTDTSVAVPTDLSEVVLGLTSPFHTAAHAADPVGFDSDSLTGGNINLLRPAGTTSALVCAYILIGRKIATS